MISGEARGSPDRTTLVAFAAVALLGGVNAVAVKQMILDLVKQDAFRTRSGGAQ